MQADLTDRQERFVFEYLKDQNASAAAVRAGYAAKSRASQASELMQNAAVRERIRMEMQSLLAELRLSALDLMKERMRAAFFRAGKLFDTSGRLLGFEEMEAEVRDSLVISGKWRKGEPEISFRQPNREPALRTLERVHERLERLNEQHYEKLERQAQAATLVPAAAWPVIHSAQTAPDPVKADEPANKAAATTSVVEQAAPARPAQVAEPVPAGIEAEAMPAPAISAPAPQTIAEKAQVPQGDFFQGVFSGSPEKPSALRTKKAQVFSGSAEKPARPSMLAKALAVLSPGKKEQKEEAAEAEEPQATPAQWQEPPPIKRRDPSLLWGGPRKYTPPEPSPALLEHLARIKHEELNAEVKREMELRAGKIKPGEVRPNYPPGYNPPWLRDERPRYAIGAGEFFFSGEEEDD